MFQAEDNNQGTQDFHHQSYQSDQGPHTNSIESFTSAIKERDIVNCMQLLQQQLRSEDLQQIDISENENAINFKQDSNSFLKQFDTFNKQKQQQLNNDTDQNQQKNSNNNDKQNKNTQQNNQFMNQNDIYQSQNNHQSENYIKQNMHRNSIQEWEQEQDDEEIMIKLYDMVEQLKSMSQMENNENQEEEQEGEIEDDNYQNNQMNDSEIRRQIALDQEEKERAFQEFLKRNEEYAQKKQKNLLVQRARKTLEQDSYQKKDFMSKKSKQICNENSHLFDESIGNRSKKILLKKQKEILQHDAINRYQEITDCTFKPNINPNSLQILGVGENYYRTADEFYEDKVEWMRKREQHKLQTQLKQNIQKGEIKRQEREKDQIGIQLDPNSMRIFERKMMNGEEQRDFLDRLEQDLENRYIRKKQLEMNTQPSFQPLIYENMRSQAMINQMQAQKANYRIQKMKEETATWNQFTSPPKQNKQKMNRDSSSKNKIQNNTISYGSNKSFVEQESIPLSDKNNIQQVLNNQQIQNKTQNINNKQCSDMNVKKLQSNNNNIKIQLNEQTNSQFTSINDSKRNNQFNSANKYNSVSTKFTSIKSNPKSCSTKKSNDQQNQQYDQNGNSLFNSIKTVSQFDGITMDQQNNGQSEQNNKNNNNDQVNKEQFSSFIQQNINKLKSTLNKMP